MRQKQTQMTLDLQPGNRSFGGGFIAGASNASARAWLVRENWPENRLWVWGASGTGKTHLLRFWAGQNHIHIYEASALSEENLASLLGEGDGRQPVRAIAIDHIEGHINEVALLHLLNRASSHGIKVVMAARQPPSWKDFTVPDLASRLKATCTTFIEEPEDRLRATLLLSLLAERQLVVPQQVTDWLWRHLPRTGEALVRAVERLDKAALERGCSISRPLAQEVLADMLEPDMYESESL